MVDAVALNTNKISSPSQTPSPAVKQKVSQFFAQTLLDQTQGVSKSSDATRSLTTQGSSKAAGFSTNLPRGSLIDIIA